MIEKKYPCRVVSRRDFLIYSSILLLNTPKPANAGLKDLFVKFFGKPLGRIFEDKISSLKKKDLLDKNINELGERKYFRGGVLGDFAGDVAAGVLADMISDEVKEVWNANGPNGASVVLNNQQEKKVVVEQLDIELRNRNTGGVELDGLVENIIVPGRSIAILDFQIIGQGCALNTGTKYLNGALPRHVGSVNSSQDISVVPSHEWFEIVGGVNGEALRVDDWVKSYECRS